MNEWEEVYLDEAFDIGSGLSKPATDFGSGFPFLSFKEVFNNFFVPDELPELVESNAEERDKCSVKKGDVFLTRTSETVKELGMSCVALKYYEDATFNGFTKRLRTNGKFEIVPEYAGYYFRSSKFRNEVTALSSASTRASLNNEMLGRLKIILPSKIEQEEIAAVLICLDRKISNLRQQNETLESIAQTLFKYWFVDFEFPNKDGKPYKSSGGAMERSELGEIPAGWRVGKLGDEVETIGGGTPSTTTSEYWENGYIPWYSPTDLTRSKTLLSLGSEKKITKLGLEKSSARLFPKYSLLLTSRATIGEITINTQEACTNQGFITIIPNETFSAYFLYGWLLTQINLIKQLASGSTFPELSKSTFRNFSFLISDPIPLIQYDQTIKPIFQKIENNIRQIQSLTKTRNVLLPKLMSGQIRIKG